MNDRIFISTNLHYILFAFMDIRETFRRVDFHIDYKDVTKKYNMLPLHHPLPSTSMYETYIEGQSYGPKIPMKSP